VTCQGAVQVKSRWRSRRQSVFRAHTAPNPYEAPSCQETNYPYKRFFSPLSVDRNDYALMTNGTGLNGRGERGSLTRAMVQCTMLFLCGIMVISLWRSTDGTDA
jgi:hypothetical protein